MIIRQIPFVLMGHLFLILIAVGRMICGWLCPFGLLQDLAYRIKTAKIMLPGLLGYLKYVTLILLTVILPFADGRAWFCRFCPSGTLEAAIPWVLWNPVNPVFGQPTVDMIALGWFFVLKILILLGIILLVIISKRPFCRIFCPLGLLFAPFNKLSLIRMEIRDSSLCNKCNACRKICPMEIKISDDPNAGECIRCLKCTKCSNVKINIGNLNKKFRINEI
jgi:polyferredoxin